MKTGDYMIHVSSLQIPIIVTNARVFQQIYVMSGKNFKSEGK